MIQKAIHGDSMKLDWMKLTEGRKIDLILCDPPYLTSNLEFDTDWDLWKIFKILEPHMSDYVWIFVWNTLSDVAKIISEYRRKFEYIWVKPQTIKTHNTVRPFIAHDICYVFIKKTVTRMNNLYFAPKELRTAGKPYTAMQHERPDTEYRKSIKMATRDYQFVNTGYREGTTVLYASHDKDRKHPTQKPLSIHETIIKAYCPPGGLVVDPCAGSGTTGIAAKNTGRDFIMVEKEERYYDIIQERLSNRIDVY